MHGLYLGRRSWAFLMNKGFDRISGHWSCARRFCEKRRSSNNSWLSLVCFKVASLHKRSTWCLPARRVLRISLCNISLTRRSCIRAWSIFALTSSTSAGMENAQVVGIAPWPLFVNPSTFNLPSQVLNNTLLLLIFIGTPALNPELKLALVMKKTPLIAKTSPISTNRLKNFFMLNRYNLR